MSDRDPAKLDRYLADADSWARDRRDGLRRSRGIAWIVAGIATLVALCEALALAALAPLKTVEPYTLLVDRQTGYVQALKPLEPQLVASDAALTQSFLVQYVIAREGFDIDTVQSDYRKVALWSAGEARSGYLARMQASDPNSPLARYPRSTVVEVAIKSVTSVGTRVALVRFDTVRLDAGGTAQPGQAWVAVLRYSYSGEPMSAADRFINPLGFKVLRYRRSAEVLPTSQFAAPQPAAASQPASLPTTPAPNTIQPTRPSYPAPTVFMPTERAPAAPRATRP